MDELKLNELEKRRKDKSYAKAGNAFDGVNHFYDAQEAVQDMDALITAARQGINDAEKVKRLRKALRQFVAVCDACGSDLDPNFQIAEVGELSVEDEARAALAETEED